MVDSFHKCFIKFIPYTLEVNSSAHVQQLLQYIEVDVRCSLHLTASLQESTRELISDVPKPASLGIAFSPLDFIIDISKLMLLSDLIRRIP